MAADGKSGSEMGAADSLDGLALQTIWDKLLLSTLDPLWLVRANLAYSIFLITACDLFAAQLVQVFYSRCTIESLPSRIHFLDKIFPTRIVCCHCRLYVVLPKPDWVPLEEKYHHLIAVSPI